MEQTPGLEDAETSPADQRATDQLLPAERPASQTVMVDAAIGVMAIGLAAGSVVIESGSKAFAPIARLMLKPPLVPAAFAPASVVNGLATRGNRVRAAATTELDTASSLLVPAVADAVLARIDLTDIVLRRVDLVRIVDAVLDRIDLTELVIQRVDLDAVAARLDLVGIADYVIEAVDLPEIIRSSTGSVATEAVRGARMQGIEADKQLQHVVDRLLLRRRARTTDAPGEVGSNAEGSHE